MLTRYSVKKTVKWSNPTTINYIDDYCDILVDAEMHATIWQIKCVWGLMVGDNDSGSKWANVCLTHTQEKWQWKTKNTAFYLIDLISG